MTFDLVQTQTLKLRRYCFVDSVCFHVIMVKINYVNQEMERKLDTMFCLLLVKLFLSVYKWKKHKMKEYKKEI